MSKLTAILLVGVVVLSGCTKKLSNTVARVRGSVVHIEKVGECEGSGFVVSEDGVICTAKHVVEGGGEFIVTFDDGTKFTTRQTLADSNYDIGFLKIEPDRLLVPLTLSPFDLRAGDPVFIMGSPLGFDNFNSVTLGIVSAEQRNLDAVENSGFGWTITFQSDSPAYPGNSGGPVFNLEGEVVGVLVAGMDSSLNYSVPVEVFADELDVIKLKFQLLRFVVPEVDKIKMLEYRIERLEENMVGILNKDNVVDEPETYEPENI